MCRISGILSLHKVYNYVSARTGLKRAIHSRREVATTPFKDFAKKLAEQMERERVDVRRNDKRETFTTYRVPKVAVVALSQEMRKRA